MAIEETQQRVLWAEAHVAAAAEHHMKTWLTAVVEGVLEEQQTGTRGPQPRNKEWLEALSWAYQEQRNMLAVSLLRLLASPRPSGDVHWNPRPLSIVPEKWFSDFVMRLPGTMHGFVTTGRGRGGIDLGGHRSGCPCAVCESRRQCSPRRVVNVSLASTPRDNSVRGHCAEFDVSVAAATREVALGCLRAEVARHIDGGFELTVVEDHAD